MAMTTKKIQINYSNKIKNIALLVLLFFNPALYAKDYNFTAAKSILNAYVETNKLAGGVIIVMKDGKEVLHFAAGKQDIEAKREMKLEK